MSKDMMTIRGRVGKTLGFFLGLIPVIVILTLWTYSTWGPAEERTIAPAILPSPLEVLEQIPNLVVNRNLGHHILISLERVGLGYLLALAVVLPLGILMASFGSIRAMFSPLVTASGYIPIATLVPLTMAWFGTDDSQKVIFLAMAFAIYLLPLVIAAIDKVPEVYLRTAYTLGASRFQAIFRVLIPIAMPDIWQSMRLAFGVGWTYLVLAEVVVLVDGLGYLIGISQRRGPREDIYLVILTITLIAWIADMVWNYLGYLLFPYKRRPA